MEKLLLVSILLVAVECHLPIVGPLLSVRPCRGQEDITLLFEPALQPKENNRYYMYVNKVFPEDSVIQFRFDSKVNITLIMQTAYNEYRRMVMTEGYSFLFHIRTEHSALGFIVKGIEPGVSPYLISFSVNKEELCETPVTGFLEVYASDTEYTDTTSCGSRTVDHTELLVHSSPTKPGDWPWHAAIYRLDGLAIKYICGGTLLSKKAVLTAAHCATTRGAKYPSDMLTVVLGKYWLTGDDQESVQKEVQKIVVHEYFNYRNLVNDIALLLLKTEVTFTDFIRPACLWNSGLKKKLKSDPIYGTVVGWGFDITDSLSKTLQKATIPIVNEVTCLRSNPVFYSRALNDFTFCAGYRNGTSVCNGDSGGAFQVFIPDELQSDPPKISGTWHVKGIVSMTMSRQDAAICDPTQYGVFTDVEKYTAWIENHWEE